MKEFAETTLRDLVATKCVGEVSPWREGDERAIEAHIRMCVEALGACPSLHVVADFNHYGSGYASYVDCFCWRTDGVGVRREAKLTHVDGLALYLCRIGPYAILGADARFHGKDVSGGGFLDAESVGILPVGDWEGHLATVEAILLRFGFTVLDGETMLRPLPFPARIETNLGRGGAPRFFDALFRWMD